ncbi:MAG: WG repeat-containing protein [Bacteroidaceae bacterium]|nr:WG repeat-containing protein [Bacteroidaceae bacterium]
MKNTPIFLIISIFILSLLSCGDKSNATRPQTGHLFVFADDSCYCINYNDQVKFQTDATFSTLFYNDIATMKNKSGEWLFITQKGDTLLPYTFSKATVFSEGYAWVIKDKDMPGAINTKGDMLISLRDVEEVRVFHESLAAFSINKRKEKLWGFLDKNGNERIKPQYRKVNNFRLGLAAVQEKEEGKWGFINLNGEVVIPFNYLEAFNFGDNGKTIVKEENRYLTIDRKGNIIQKHHYDEIIPDGSLLRVRNDKSWGWCNSNGEIIIPTQYDEIRPFGKSAMAPVKINGKWAYINQKGEICIKRQFADAYPFINGNAVVKAGTVWGVIDEKGVYIVNPQYDNVSNDYLQQSLGEGCSLSSLHI